MQVDDGFTSLSLVGAEPFHNLPPLFEYQDHAYQRTAWMDENLKPEHVGVYERDYGGEGDPEDITYNYWDGTLWYAYGDTPGAAVGQFHDRMDSAWQSEPWRGLTKPVMEKLA